MIITKTPFRISFVGGGSDLEAFYSQHQGAVISTSINKFMYISSHKFFEEDQLRVKYSQTETVASIDSINHPIIREVCKLLNLTKGVEISSNADVPAGTGLGSSSAFTVGLFHNLYTHLNRHIPKPLLAEAACNLEINILNEPIGKQDQYASCFGGLNIITFNPDGTVGVEPIHLSKDIYKRLQENLIMLYYGSQRSASSILAEQKMNSSQSQKISTLKSMVKLVFESRDALFEGNLNRFSEILHENWILKKELASRISDDKIDTIYNTALKNGAKGGKLLGAGGGGFFLFYCEKEKQPELMKALPELRPFPFKFENEGSRIIYIGDEYNGVSY